MKIWFISDTHNQHEGLNVPDVDLVIHCGDESTHGNPWMNEPEARRFFDWYSDLEVDHKIFVPGNHSTAIEQQLILADEYPGIMFLIHESVVCRDIKLFGSPYTPRFHEWAYMKKRTQLDPVWQHIPEETEILITHGPPKGVLDITHDNDHGHLVQVGCAALRRHVDTRVRPRIHAFGHIHDERGVSNFGVFHRGATQYINCSCCDLSGQLKNHGIIIDWSEMRC